MTRDTSGPQDAIDSDDVYAALWQAAPFPRLPSDAPKELKKLTIDIEDPQRVYAIYRASRRHHFQILVERYIIQLRYGCQVKQCNTPTCFSCRKRLAGGAPVRRYNATSARTLAVYLASQDNPELGLCQHPSVNPPEPRSKIKTPPKQNGDSAIIRCPDAPIRRSSQSRPKIKVEVLSDDPEKKAVRKTRSHQDQERHHQSRGGKNVTREDNLVTKILEEPTKKDHKSFVQNVFGTTAFKMLEWLSPRNFELLTRNESEELALRRARSKQGVALPHTDLEVEAVISTETSNIGVIDDEEKRSAPEPSAVDKDEGKENIEDEERLESAKFNKIHPVPIEHQQLESRADVPDLSVPFASTEISSFDGSPVTHGSIESKVTSNGAPKNPGSKGRRNSRAGVLESKSTKSILNTPTSPRIQSYSTDILPSRDPKSSKPQRKLSRHTSIASPGIEELETDTPENAVRPVTVIGTEDSKPEPRESKKISNAKTAQSDPEEARREQQVTTKKPVNDTDVLKTPTEVLLPQSLSQLSIDIIDLLCDILQEDQTMEPHSFKPTEICRFKVNRAEPSTGLSRSSHKRLTRAYSSRLKSQWLTFIEQSFFDVLSKPDALLRSFCDEEGLLFDTQTIWYLMVRITRVAPSVVFHSLWIAAGTLFTPPPKDLGYEWKAEPKSQSTRTEQAISNFDAARIMTICLHALVAAAPLVTNASQLANMSRIRSFGLLSTLGRDSTPISLCLDYEDAFTDELALRLARRLFAAIPTRRRYTELAEMNSPVLESSEPDLLDSMFSSLRFLDLRPSILDFSDLERDLHEKRLPTLILDWARTVMMQDWQGVAEVSSDGSFGGALAMIAAIYKNRKSLLLGDIHFYSTYFNDRLDSMDMPVEWLSFERNRRTVHLLDYPYLFNPATLVTYFRSINFSRMSRSFEAARSMQAFAHYTAAEKQLITDAHRRHRLYERLRTATSKFNVLHIRRDNVLVDAFNQLWRREERELMRPLKIRLGEEGGEEGSDSGGVQQEFFRLAIAEALNADYGTFTVDQRTKMTWFHPGSPEPLWKFELIGLIVSLAVYNGLTLPVTFPKGLYRKLLGRRMTELHHIEDGWPDLANGLTTLLEWDEKEGNVEDVFCRTYEFSVEQFGQPVSRTMDQETHWPQFSDSEKLPNPTDAPLVTGENRSDYVSDYIYWLTDVSVRPQFEAFKRGFLTCIAPKSITLFTPEILQSVVEGVQEIDIPDLRRYTRYVGWDASHKTVKDFWSVVKKYNFEQKRKLLEFVTASDRVPVGGMRNLQFVVQRNGVGDGHLPTSYTCYGTLLLPEYSSREVLREKMAMALENSKGFGFA